MKRLIVLILFIANICFGQNSPLNTMGKVVPFSIKDFKTASLNVGPNAPLIQEMVVKLPTPDGNLKDFVLNETLISDRKIQNIQTFDGTSNDGTIKIKVTLLPERIEALMHTPDGYFIVEPFDSGPNLYIVYGMNEVPADRMKCGSNEEIINNIVKKNGRVLSSSPFPVGSQLRVFRMAAAATGELVTFYEGQANALARIVSVMNAANLIYELEASIRFQLITATTDYSLLFTNPATDPFTPDPNFASANQSQIGFNTMNTNGTLPYSNYDVGHTFSIYTATGISCRGQAGTAPCNNSFKARGWTEWSSSTNLSTSGHLGLVVGVMVHEVGHQFSAAHTYNATGGSVGSPTFCESGWSSTDAIEPGGGSTLMSYGNNCTSPTNQSLTGNNNLQYFNTKSLEKIYNFLISTANCHTASATNNTPPVANAGADITIPKGTPFKLSGTASDANNDAMSYTWEQYDVAVANDKGALGTSVAGVGGYTAVNSTTAPLFRSERSTTTTERTFPKLAYILNNENNPADNEGEDLPQVARTMKFRFTVRDNKPNGGGVDSDETVVTVANSGPFLVTSQNVSELWIYNGSRTATITWSVNGTNTAPLNVANVKISLSTDGGNTFPVVLAASTPNDGSETIIIPNNQTTQGRIKIEPVGAFAFFDINNANVTISTSCSAEISSITPAEPVTASAGNSALNLNLSAYGTGITSFSGTIDNSDARTNMVFSNSGSCSSANTPYYDIYAFKVITGGNYTFTKSSGTLGSYVINLYNGTYSSSNPCANWVNSSGNFCSPLVCLSSNVTANLTPGTYYLVVSGFSSTDVGNYTITPSGGTVYNLVPTPNAPYAYTYPVINSNGTIVAFSDNANLTNTAIFPTGNYTLYGLSYQGGLNLGSYVGTSFVSFQTLLDNNTICGKLSTNSKNVTINCGALPNQPSAFTVSSSTVCQGQNNVVYTIPTVAGATSYTWGYSGTGATITGNTESVTVSFSTMATAGTLSVAANNSCGTSTARTVEVTMNGVPTATLSGTQTIVVGQSANLSVMLTGTSPWSIVVNGTTYNNVQSSPHPLTFTPISTTTYTLSSVSNVCGTVNVSSNNTATVTVNPAAACDNEISGTLVSNTNAICPNESAVLSVLDAPLGYTYTWRVNESVVANENKPTLMANQVGIYRADIAPNWYQVEPTPTHEHLYGLTFLNDYNGWIVGEGGTILRTQDAGENWSKIYSGVTQTLNDVHFTTSNTGWIAGDGGKLLKSTTGGVSWTNVGVAFNSKAVDFFSPKIGIVVGSSGNVMFTSDEGKTWTNGSSATANTLNDVKFVSSNVALAVGDGGVIVRSTDAGQTWSNVASGVTANFSRVYFYNQNLGWIIGNNGAILRTTDGGVVWNSVTITGEYANREWKDVYFTDTTNGWLIDYGNTLLKTIDGGNSWSLVTRFFQDGISLSQANRIVFTNRQSAYIIGVWGAILKSTNGGNNWAAKGNSSSSSLNDVQFLDANNLIAVGDNAKVLKSSNKGKSWNKIAPTGLEPNNWLKAVHFISSSVGWMGDSKANIFKTTDGGTTWQKQRTAVDGENLSDIVFINPNKGFGIGVNGLFIETLDGGVNWSVRNIGSGASFLKIFFVNSTTGWICGQNGLLLKTMDSGATWQPQSTSTTNQLSSVFFIDSSIGWAVVNALAGAQTIIKTTDGGNTWSTIATTPTYVKDIKFVDSNKGYICGGNGYIATTTDGGATWVQNVTNTATPLNTLAFNSLGTAVIVGDANTIFRYNSNACTFTTNLVNVANVTLISAATMSGTSPLSTPFVYKSNQTISSSQLIHPGANIEYKAGNSITLTPGFSTSDQTTFQAEIKGCNN